MFFKAIRAFFVARFLRGLKQLIESFSRIMEPAPQVETASLQSLSREGKNIYRGIIFSSLN